eukprot:snap_masked-scaffold_10-processed-gene-0.59-mRNA-1 protein AED:1.00 eAED:1.00 QI:0/0/0/0/1/1/2/0/96
MNIPQNIQTDTEYIYIDINKTGNQPKTEKRARLSFWQKTNYWQTPGFWLNKMIGIRFRVCFQEKTYVVGGHGEQDYFFLEIETYYVSFLIGGAHCD